MYEVYNGGTQTEKVKSYNRTRKCVTLSEHSESSHTVLGHAGQIHHAWMMKIFNIFHLCLSSDLWGTQREFVGRDPESLQHTLALTHKLSVAHQLSLSPSCCGLDSSEHHHLRCRLLLCQVGCVTKACPLNGVTNLAADVVVLCCVSMYAEHFSCYHYHTVILNSSRRRKTEQLVDVKLERNTETQTRQAWYQEKYLWRREGGSKWMSKLFIDDIRLWVSEALLGCHS